MHSSAIAKRSRSGIITAAAITAIVVMLLFFSLSLTVQKQPSNPQTTSKVYQPPLTPTAVAVSNSSSPDFWYVGASVSDPSVALNTGLRSLIQVKDQSVAGVLSFWASEAMSNNLWAQVGYYIDQGSRPFAFFQIWNLTDRSEVATGTTNVTDGTHLFSMTTSNGTMWSFSVDSQVFGVVDMHTSTSSPNYPIYAMSEESGVQNPFAFSQILFSSATQVLILGTWHNATSAKSFGNAWGVQGHEQNQEFVDNEIAVGAGNAIPSAGETLWNSTYTP